MLQVKFISQHVYRKLHYEQSLTMTQRHATNANKNEKLYDIRSDRYRRRN